MKTKAVFYNVEDLRALRDTLDEAIDLFAEAQANPQKTF